MIDIAIVGGGASGVLLALQLMRRDGKPLSVALIDRAADPGLGIAYATPEADHLLNTPADVMSIYPDAPEHFTHWLEANRHAAGARFLSRQLYGRYLQSALAEAMARGRGRLRIVTGTAVAVADAGERARVTIQDAAAIEARAVVLATGHRPPSVDKGALRGNPWDPGLLAGLDRHASVLVIGTGLTMIDVVISLRGHGHRGKIVALSRRGLLPRPHTASPPALVAPEVEVLFQGALSARLAVFRKLATAAGGWEALMQALRPRNQDLWQSLDEGEKRRFLRHLRPWWDVHRHRVAPSVWQRIAEAMADGQLAVVAGRIVAMDAKPDRVGVAIAPRGAGEGEVERRMFDRVIDCRGPRNGIDDRDPLYAQMAADGLIRPDPLGLGLDVDHTDALVGAAGRPSARLFALGPPTRGRYWEITAIPDIRAQAARLAGRLADLFAAPGAAAP